MKDTLSIGSEMEVCQLQSAFRGCLQSLEMFSRQTIRDPLRFLELAWEPLVSLISDWLAYRRGFKIQLCLKLKMKKLNGEKTESTSIALK